jgi:ABC-type uncharacterized transport system substrate-binding protein
MRIVIEYKYYTHITNELAAIGQETPVNKLISYSVSKLTEQLNN